MDEGDDFAVTEFDLSLLDVGEGATVCADDAGPRFAPPPPEPAPPATLLARLRQELGFTESEMLLRKLETWDSDLFSCLPVNAHLYTSPLFSTNPQEVAEHVDSAVPGDSEPIDMNAHSGVPSPSVPTTPADLPAYIEAAQKYFLAELEAREHSYVRYLLGFCRSLIRHYRRLLKKRSREDLASRLRATIWTRYYRDLLNLARPLFLHLYITLTRSVSWRLHSQQVGTQFLFVSLSCAWVQQRQLTCVFQPCLFNHGVVLVEGQPVTPTMLRHVNHIREGLGLPLIRASLGEESGPLSEPPPAPTTSPRSAAFLVELIRSKLEAYSTRCAAQPSHTRDHAYCRPRSPVCWGTTVSALWRDVPGADDVLPCDPVPPPRLGVLPVEASELLPADVSLETIETEGFHVTPSGFSYGALGGMDLNRFLEL